MLELGQTDDPTQLVPGVPARLAEFAVQLSRLGEQAELTASQLARVDLSSWTGAAAQAYQDYHDQEPVRWQSAARAFGDVAQALDEYARVLSSAQAVAATAVVEWNLGNRQQAAQLLTEARDQAAQASMTADQVVAQSTGAPTGPLLGQAASANTNASAATVPTVYIDADRHPETAQHVQEAQSGTIWRGDTSTSGTPLPSVLTIDRPNAKSNRADSLHGIPTRPGKDRDEYPPAMFEEGGTGASVKYINPSDNRGAGSSMGRQINALNLGNGQRVQIAVLNSEDEDDNTDDTDDGAGDGGGEDHGGDDDGNEADGDDGDDGDFGDDGDTADTGDDGDGAGTGAPGDSADDDASLAAITHPLWG